MATVKVFSAAGVKELKCFDNLVNVPYLSDEIECDEDPFDDIAEIETE